MGPSIVQTIVTYGVKELSEIEFPMLFSLYADPGVSIERLREAHTDHSRKLQNEWKFPFRILTPRFNGNNDKILNISEHMNNELDNF